MLNIQINDNRILGWCDPRCSTDLGSNWNF